MRRRRAEQNFSDDDAEYREDPVTAPQPDRIRGPLLDAIGQLHPQAAEILILHYEQDYTDAEIAKMLGKSRLAVAMTLQRARARLKKLLCDQGKDKHNETRKDKHRRNPEAASAVGFKGRDRIGPSSCLGSALYPVAAKP